jgi:glycosyltransferase involved in cell wall biosynthesis
MPSVTKISIVIPARNEEEHIRSVVSQFTAVACPVGLEVIVANDGSTDRTEEHATAAGARVITADNPMRTIARVRNQGARFATGDVIVFCDADTRLSNVRRLYRLIEREFTDRRVIGAMPRIEVFPEDRKLRDTLFHSLYNWIIRASFLFPQPFGSGQCQIVRGAAFRRVGGYNERQVHGEDAALFAALRRAGRIRYMSGVSVYESPRRYREIGYIRLMVVSLSSLLGQAMTNRNVLTEWRRVG